MQRVRSKIEPARPIRHGGLPDEAEGRAERGCIVIPGARRPRAGWAAAARRMRGRGEDGLLDPPVGTRFDREEWR